MYNNISNGHNFAEVSISLYCAVVESIEKYNNNTCRTSCAALIKTLVTKSGTTVPERPFLHHYVHNQHNCGVLRRSHKLQACTSHKFLVMAEVEFCLTSLPNILERLGLRTTNSEELIEVVQTFA